MKNELNIPWHEGEKLIYQASALGVTAADLSFEVLPKTTIFNLPAWHFKVMVKTHGFLKRLHNYEVTAESYIHASSLNSLEWRTDAIEGKHAKLCVERHLPEQQKYFIFRETDGVLEHHETRDFTHPPWYCDIFSFFYIVRILKPGEIVFLTRNYESKPAQFLTVTEESVHFNGIDLVCEKLKIHFDGKEHIIWREKSNTNRIIKANVSSSFANATILLKV